MSRCAGVSRPPDCVAPRVHLGAGKSQQSSQHTLRQGNNQGVHQFAFRGVCQPDIYRTLKHADHCWLQCGNTHQQQLEKNTQVKKKSQKHGRALMRKKGKRTMWQSPPLINTSRVLNKIIAFYKKCFIQPYHSGKLKYLYKKSGAEWNGGGDDSICFGEFLQQSRMELGKVTEIILLAKHTCQIFLGFSSGDKSGIFGNWCKEKLESFEAKSNPTILQFLGIICSFGVYKSSQSRLSTSLREGCPK